MTNKLGYRGSFISYVTQPPVDFMLRFRENPTTKALTGRVETPLIPLFASATSVELVLTETIEWHQLIV